MSDHIDQMIDEAIAEILRMGGPLTSANIADVASDMAITNTIETEEVDQLWHELDMRVRSRFNLSSDAERITKLSS